MNKRASSILYTNVLFLIILIVFFVGMLSFVYSKMNSASVWEDYYAKEIVKVIDLSKPGDTIVIDVQRATEIAQKNKIANFEQIFSFDNFNNEVCVKLSLGRASCYNYFNDVNVAIVPGENKWIFYAEPINRIHFSIIKKEAKNA